MFIRSPFAISCHMAQAVGCLSLMVCLLWESKSPCSQELGAGTHPSRPPLFCPKQPRSPRQCVQCQRLSEVLWVQDQPSQVSARVLPAPQCLSGRLQGSLRKVGPPAEKLRSNNRLRICVEKLAFLASAVHLQLWSERLGVAVDPS